MAVSSRFQLYSHDLTKIVHDIWKANDITKAQTVNGVEQNVKLSKLLNIKFFTFREEVKSVDNRDKFPDYASWLVAAFASIDKAFARINIINEENLSSPDLDTGELTADVEIIIQPEKIEALEVYWNNLRRLFRGETYTYTNAEGKNVSMFLTLGNLEVRDGIDTSQLGVNISYVSSISVSYLAGGVSYKDFDLDISFSPQFDINTFRKIRFFEFAFDMVKDGDTLNQQVNPYTVGDINRNVASGITFNMYDISTDPAIQDIKSRIMLSASDRVEDKDGNDVTKDNFGLMNEPAWLRFTDKKSGFKYYYLMVMKSGSVTCTNGQFVILKTIFKKIAPNIRLTQVV